MRNYWIAPGLERGNRERQLLMITISDIVCRETNISFELIKDKDRTFYVRMARQLIMYFCYNYCKPRTTTKAIGRFINRDHATVLHGKLAIARDIRHDQETLLYFNKIETSIKNYLYGR